MSCSPCWRKRSMTPAMRAHSGLEKMSTSCTMPALLLIRLGSATWGELVKISTVVLQKGPSELS